MNWCLWECFNNKISYYNVHDKEIIEKTSNQILTKPKILTNVFLICCLIFKHASFYDILIL